MPFPTLSKTTLRQQVSEASFQKGLAYYQQGAVVSLVKRGDHVQAEVEGSEYTPYRVRIGLDAGGITSAECTCPYDWGGWCKHIVATLLACLDQPDTVEERPPLQAQLAALSREQLQALLLKLAEQEPDLIERIEAQVALVQAGAGVVAEPPSAKASGRRTPIDPTPFRRQVQTAIHSLDRLRASDAYHQVGSVVGEVRQLLRQAQDFIDGGDSDNALRILEAVTAEYAAAWFQLDDSDGEAADFFQELDPVWTEALLSTELTPDERRQWRKKLETWRKATDDYGIDEAFAAARTAAQQGWDDPTLQQVLRGERSQPVWNESADESVYAGTVTNAYLKVLDRRQQHEAYLNLARTQGCMEAYVLHLAGLGRVQEAVAEALHSLTRPAAALALAKLLRERGDVPAALQVAEHGLSLSDAQRPLQAGRAALATWLCDLAIGLGDRQRALRAANIAFQERPSLAGYQQVQELAGEQWPEQQQGLLEHLRGPRPFDTSGVLDVFLHEGLIDDAITLAQKRYIGHAELARVMDAALARHPAWVIQAARRQAEEIIDRGKADLYVAAVQWLKKAKAAYQVAQRTTEWQDYLNGMRTRHQRKYKLMGLLKGW